MVAARPVGRLCDMLAAPRDMSAIPRNVSAAPRDMLTTQDTYGKFRGLEGPSGGNWGVGVLYTLSEMDNIFPGAFSL